MENSSRVVASKGRRGSVAKPEFAFGPADIPTGDAANAMYRRAAWESYKGQGIPDVSLEAWRRTDLRAMPLQEFRLPAANSHLDLAAVPEELLNPLVANQHGGQIVLAPGGATVSVEEDLRHGGLIFSDLKTAQTEHPELLARVLGKTVRSEEGKFAALAAALATNGIVLYVPKNMEVKEPLHSVLWGPGPGLAHLSHLLVYVDEGAEVTYVHESASPTELADAMHAGIVEIQVMAGASLRFVELQSWGRHVWNFTHERVRVEKGARVDWIFGAMGSRLTKNFSEIDLAGEGSTGRMSGFYFTDDKQHLDHDTQQNHLAPHTTSDLLFKGALKGKSRSVWQGMIYVAKGAQKSDGYQANRNLVLEEGARADSIPGLEILADDVRCTHGATVGKLEQEPLFYLRSRGIPEKEAERIVVDGFFDPIMQRIPYEGVRQRFRDAILQKMA